MSFSDLFGTLDPFGSSSFNSSNTSVGFADFSHMSKSRDPFEGRATWLPDYQKVWEVKLILKINPLPNISRSYSLHGL